MIQKRAAERRVGSHAEMLLRHSETERVINIPFIVRGATSMRISARNHIRGTVVQVKKGVTTSHVRIDIGGNILTSSITNEAVDDLGIKVDDDVSVVIKASDVMITVD